MNIFELEKFLNENPSEIYIVTQMKNNEQITSDLLILYYLVFL